MIYLDYAANTPVNTKVLDRFVDIELKHIYNPNSTNPLAKETRNGFLSASSRICQLLGIKETEIIFTSSATESNNLAIKGIAHYNRKKGKHIITSFLEHSSVNGAIGSLIQEGYEVDYVRILSDGKVDLEHLLELLREDTVLVTLCHIESETGLVQNINEIGQVIKAHSSSFFHVDGTQAVGKINVDLSYIDSYCFAAHKFYGLNGIGALILKEGLIIEPLHHGGISTTSFRSGTPSFALVESMAYAMELIFEAKDEYYNYVSKLKDIVVKELRTYDKVRINSLDDSSPYIINISLKKIKGEDVKNNLAHLGICLSTKSACCAVYAPSRPVYELTKDKKAARSTLRISLSHLTSEDEIRQFLLAFERIYRELDN